MAYTWPPTSPRAWCVFNGTTVGTNAPTAGFGITSITRTGTGLYTINFAVTFANTNFGVLGTSNAGILDSNGTKTTTTKAIRTFNDAGIFVDPSEIFVAFFGDLA